MEYDESDMGVSSGEVLSPGMEFSYDYDFGTTTTLVLKVVGKWTGKPERKILLMARNEKPEILCEECEKNPARQICAQCKYDGNAWLCGDCALTHSCGEEMLLPVVNSPRSGECGYMGNSAF